MPLHTQREEDIKEFERKFTIWDNKHILADNQNEYIESKPFKDFISNIYIKIAEGEIKRLEKKIIKIDIEIPDTLSRNIGYNQAIKQQINYWQEELNKLKA